MIGKLGSSGIVLRPYAEKNQWTATVNFWDAGFCQDKSTEGKINTRYFQSIETAIDTILADTQAMGIEFYSDACLSLDDNDEFCPPDNWRDILQEQAQRIGWRAWVGVTQEGER